MSALTIRFHRGGVYLPRLGLWLDPHEPQLGSDKVFVSHAHSDHTALHREIILSEPTSKLMHARMTGEWLEHMLAFGQPRQFEGMDLSYRLTLVAAGHIFGSAMALIEAEGASLLYTGDFKLRPGLSAERCDPRPADILIMETTYGRPGYRFPSAADVLQGVIRFCREALDNDETPVLLGYSLGKSQELLCGLGDARLPIMLHGQVHKLTEIYKQFGQCFPPYEKHESASAKGKVLLCPPSVANSAMLRNLGRVRTAVLTGWAIDSNCRYRYQTDAAFPLSDHADFADLIEMVRRVNPKKIYTLHGFAADFAQTLRELGFDAQALSEEEQLSLSLVSEPLAFQGKDRPGDTHPKFEDSNRFPTDQESRLTDHASRLTPHEAPAITPDQPDIASPSASFHTFASTCSTIGGTTKKLEKIQLLADYLKTLEAASLGPASTWFTGHPFSPNSNKVLNLGWAIIRDALCAAGDIDQGGFGQVYLKHSDLGETAFEVLLKISPSASTLALRDIETLFEQLYGARGPLGKLPLLRRVLRQCTALEGKYLIKILTGDLRIGLKEGLVEEAIARAFESPLDAIKNTNLLLGNIGETAQLAQRRELGSATLVPFRPVKYMLASPEETAEDIWRRIQEWPNFQPAKLATKESAAPWAAAQAQIASLTPHRSPSSVWIEDKYDGIRAQFHKVGHRVALYSRDLKEITTTFLELVDAVRAFPVDFVIDGEILAMRDDRALPFAELQRRLGRREGDLFLSTEIPVQFIAFDLLWFNGESCLNKPLESRRRILETLTGLHLSWITPVGSAEEIDAAFAAARARGNEGLMIKDPGSVYTPGRRGLAWLKLKKAYATLDCVVVGAEYGHGKRKDVLSDYTFAVRDESTGQLKTIGKAYTGLTDEEIAELTKHFLSKAIRQQGRYFQVEPDTVLEIAFDAIQSSARHSSGLAMRFPRIVRIRKDKSATEIDTLAAARDLAKR
ncbi:MAG: ATP-dependent DNA ligase [Verrucomicrobia bacterium]|nr:ATP-dependent DNA ligase [Verrucomicrobiota bacterium]